VLLCEGGGSALTQHQSRDSETVSQCNIHDRSSGQPGALLQISYFRSNLLYTIFHNISLGLGEDIKKPGLIPGNTVQPCGMELVRSRSLFCSSGWSASPAERLVTLSTSMSWKSVRNALWARSSPLTALRGNSLIRVTLCPWLSQKPIRPGPGAYSKFRVYCQCTAIAVVPGVECARLGRACLPSLIG
jgi:hypothetical protein